MIYPHSTVCLKCQRTLSPKQLGASLIELTCKDGESYKIYSVDIYECPSCKFEVYAGWSDPTYQHEPGFQSLLEQVEEYSIKFY